MYFMLHRIFTVLFALGTTIYLPIILVVPITLSKVIEAIYLNISQKRILFLYWICLHGLSYLDVGQQVLGVVGYTRLPISEWILVTFLLLRLENVKVELWTAMQNVSVITVVTQTNWFEKLWQRILLLRSLKIL